MTLDQFVAKHRNDLAKFETFCKRESINFSEGEEYEEILDALLCFLEDDDY